jgi:tetratricopeptide (TPR) repeat protein
LYVSGALVLALALGRGAISGVLTGIWAGISAACIYALATRLFPEEFASLDPIGGYRLSEPVGYWNALGLLASLGMLLALGLVARSERLVVRLLAAGSSVPIALTLYFTFSRGAWIALVVGLLVALALDPRRLQLAAVIAVILPWPALAVLVAASSGPLTEAGGHTLAAAAADGRDVAALAVGLMLVASGAAALAAGLEPHVRLAPHARRIGDGALVCGIILLTAVSIVALGGPSGIARSFEAPPETVGTDLNGRLFDLSGSGRVEQWRTALDLASENPLVGSGAGSYKRFWLEHRATDAPVRDAHSLYLETLAELGPVGLALVLAAFCVPLVLAVRDRRRPLVPIAAATLVAYLAHAGIDWDWELPILTLVALGCAGVIVAEGGTPREPARWRRLALLGAVGLLVPAAVIAALGNRAEAAAAAAFDARDFERSATEAKRAERLAPWSVEPLVLLGRAQAAGGDFAAARATFERVLAREPDHWRAWLELAAVSSGANREAALRSARALNPLESHIDDLEEGPWSNGPKVSGPQMPG